MAKLSFQFSNGCVLCNGVVDQALDLSQGHRVAQVVQSSTHHHCSDAGAAVSQNFLTKRLASILGPASNLILTITFELLDDTERCLQLLLVAGQLL